VGDALRQYNRSLNFVADRRRTLHALFEFSHWLMLVPTVLYFAFYLSWATLAFYFSVFLVLSNFTNTVWYHRYCSHRSFRFSSRWYPRLILWLNPLGYREEVYALVHYVHHMHADGEKDPNGPRLGWLGNYVASYFEIDTNVTPEEYERIKGRLAHLHMPFSSHTSFQRWACVESVPHYLARWAFASVFWCGLWYAVGGLAWVMAWFAVQFCWHAVVRDFNFRGHGKEERPRQVDGWDMDRSSYALNQRFYGYLAGEWHNNHHARPGSANCAFLPGQVDVPFLLIRLMCSLRIVASYNDHRAHFLRTYGASTADVQTTSEHSNAAAP
jgi:stearoyl-CoA desaturase (delta-9 desaturase)